MSATVLAFKPKPKRTRQVSALQIELDSRTLEERRFAREAEPLLRRLELIVHEHGVAAWQTWAALSAMHTRHARRWSPQDPEAAA